MLSGTFTHVAVALLTLMAVVIAGPIQKGKAIEDGEAKADELTSKLSRLKALLRELQSEDDKVSDNQKIIEATTTTAPQETTPIVEDVKEKITKDITTEPEGVINMKKFVDSLSPRDIEELKVLKQLIERSREKEEDELETEALRKADFSDKAFKDSDEGAKDVNWRDLARQLQTERDELYLNRRRPDDDDDHKHVSAYAVEGSFGNFRNEIKNSVEKNLLSDIALAIHSGIPVDEIIQDLSLDESPR